MEITISLPYQQFALFRFKDAFGLEKKIHELIESCNGYEAARFFHALNNMPLLAHDDFSIGVVDFRFRPLVWL